MSCADDDNNSNNTSIKRASVAVDNSEQKKIDWLKYKGQHKIQFPLLSLQAF